jgi:hypothetical protein
MNYEWNQGHRDAVVGIILLLVCTIPMVIGLIRNRKARRSIMPWVVTCAFVLALVYTIIKLFYPGFIRINGDIIEFRTGLKTMVFKGNQIEKLKVWNSNRGFRYIDLYAAGAKYDMHYPKDRDARRALIHFAREQNIALDGEWPQAEIDEAISL